MIITLSPSKGLDFETPTPSSIHTIPDQLEDSQLLVNEAKKLDIKASCELMDVSENISILNVQRFKQWNIPFTTDNAKAALFAFKGAAYSAIEKEKYDESDLAYAQDHLRILSGLYGILRPMDLIQPYRLEMKTRLENPRGDNLYLFWGDRITQKLNEILEEQTEQVLVNLASNEYFKSVNPKLLNGRLLNITFKESKEGQTRVIAIFAKRARGMMTDFILRNRLEHAEDMKDFGTAGYKYSAKESTEDNWVFTRPQTDKK
ncbi:MAG: peroxide stress protein YaaA [Proteobacteria bacterium]|nr:peroxide stress protein YaaA [Pseudomonadota bacterium]MBU1648413.1 peroxide stress protein YaaA [Pseudomonadota bacterium]MBU1986013.1 peroxide stress protein YaaA [Pseudomonadota bacterium]